VFKGDRVSSQEIVAFGHLLAKHGYSKVTVGGGDPLSREDLPEILEGLSKQGLDINLDTVGTAFLFESDTIFFGRLKIPRFDPAEIAPYVNSIGIPLDGAEPTTALAFRTGRENIIDEQQRIIRRLAEYDIPVSINTVVSSINVGELKRMFDIVNKLPVYKWQLFQFMPIGPLGSTNAEMFEMDHDRFCQAMTGLYSLNNRHGNNLIIEGKSAVDRANRYLIIDDRGLAWIPVGDGANRIQFGNIRGNSGQDVLEAITNYDNHLKTPRISLGMV